jgi:hypothetical protein
MEIEVQRTLVKSEPELRELIEADPHLGSGRIRIEMAEKGFGTNVKLVADEGEGFAAEELEQLLDALAEPQKRPFTAS